MAIRRGVLDKRYIFEYDVGQWTFGTIQVLKEKSSGDLKTCKTVPKSLIRNTHNVLARLRALQELQHPHICSITDVLEDRDRIFILSEFTQGGDVQDWMQRLDDGNWLHEGTCAAYVRQALLALAHSHAASVYHRDLRPSNLSLTTKLPDAIVKVSDFGLAAILDPDNAIIQKRPTPYSVPEILKSAETVRSSPPDMWSVGVIAHALLVGHAPAESSGGANAGWRLARRVQGGEDDGWSERSPMSRDFVQRLLRPAMDRPTAAKALHHPWLKGLQPVAGISWRPDADPAQELRHRTLCYLLGVLLLPAIVPHRDFEQLRAAFQQSDPDHDGFVPRAVGQRLLLGRCNLNEAVVPALNIVDILKTDTLDLCEAACADLIVREFFASGPTGAPLVGPLRAGDLVPRMVRRFFEVFGDRRGGAGGVQQALASASAIRAKLRTATAGDIETHVGVRYDELLACLPGDRTIDGQVLVEKLAAGGGRGTPLGSHDEMPPLKVEAPWTSTFGLDVISIFQSCGSGFKRDQSPHSIQIF
mmetsp:Transcript_55202/g.155329  ORF Transcript_55202/g.155329 Transcript_55202/m.155329 type:complete len:531 (-) Transcript_55202:171-1763(-)